MLLLLLLLPLLPLPLSILLLLFPHLLLVMQVIFFNELNLYTYPYDFCICYHKVSF